jgi:hypothetical protein
VLLVLLPLLGVAIAAPSGSSCTAGGSCAATGERDFTPESGEWYGEFWPEVPHIK